MRCGDTGVDKVRAEGLKTAPGPIAHATWTSPVRPFAGGVAGIAELPGRGAE
jgi:hypothetical protein